MGEHNCNRVHPAILARSPTTPVVGESKVGRCRHGAKALLLTPILYMPLHVDMIAGQMRFDAFGTILT